MSDLNLNEIRSLIHLLDDPDPEVTKHVEQRFMSLGIDCIPILEEAVHDVHDPLTHERLSRVIHLINFESLKNELTEWANSEEQDLLTGVWLISRFRYPLLSKQDIHQELDRIKLDVWIELRYDLSSIERIRILNNVFYERYHFRPASMEEYHEPGNSFINKVLETRKGNPISMSVVYQLVAQSLNIPVFGVNLPQHFILAYRDDTGLESMTAFNKEVDLDVLGHGKVLFYINAFNKGTILTRANLEQFLKQIHFDVLEEYFEPCSNLEIAKRMLRNLMFAYHRKKHVAFLEDTREMLRLLGEPEENMIIRDQDEDMGNESDADDSDPEGDV